MANPLFNMIGNQLPQNNMMRMMQQFQQFRNSFQGDPKQQIQQMLNSGKVSQEQYNQAVQMANTFAQMLGNK